MDGVGLAGGLSEFLFGHTVLFARELQWRHRGQYFYYYPFPHSIHFITLPVMAHPNTLINIVKYVAFLKSQSKS